MRRGPAARRRVGGNNANFIWTLTSDMTRGHLDVRNHWLGFV